MTQINYSSSQMAQIDQLREYVAEACQQKGIDPSTYLSALDGNMTAELVNDPAFQAYWSLAAMQLTYLLSGSAPDMSMSGDIVFDEDKVAAVYSNPANADLKELANEILQDDPALLAFFTGEDPEQVSGGSFQFLTNNASSMASHQEIPEDAEQEVYVAHQAREFADRYKMGDGMYWLIEYEEGIRAAEGNILTQLNAYDAELAKITDMFKGGDMTAEQYQAEVGNISAYREALIAMVQQLESSMQSVMEMYSKMIEQANEMQMSVINNMRPV